MSVVVRRPLLRSRGGCIACKLSKRKCDEAKPRCGHCAKVNKECQWATSPFLNQQLEKRRQQGKVAVPVAITGDQNNVRISFLLHNVFTGANHQTDALTVHTELQFAKETSSLTWNCLHAMALIYWGSVHKDDVTLAAGYKARGTSLGRLRDAMRRPNADLVAAVALARLLDTLLPDAKSQWMIHTQGLTKLFLTLGPEAFQVPAMRRLLENNRWVCIMAHSVLRQPFPLDTYEWNSIPWVEEKDMLQELLDIYSMLPRLHYQWDTGVEMPLRKFVQQLQEWRISVEDEIEESKQSLPGQECPWQDTIAFKKLHHAYAVILYDMIVIVLVRYLNAHNENLLGPPLQAASTAANEIASILPWLLQDEHKSAGALYAGGPANVVYQFWKIFDPVKAVWVAEMIRQIDAAWNSLMILDLRLVE